MDTPGLHHHGLYQDVSLLCHLPSSTTDKMEIPIPSLDSYFYPCQISEEWMFKDH